MKKAILFVKKNAFGLLLVFVNITFFTSIFIEFTGLQEGIITGAFFITWIIAEIQNRKYKALHLKERGLTFDDVRNIKFVKNWQETRKKGLLSYCFKDGGAICGSALFLVTSLLIFMVVPNFTEFLTERPGNMFLFIGCTYILAAVICVIIYRVTWPYQQRRFNKLTDPLNHEFSLKALQQPD